MKIKEIINLKTNIEKIHINQVIRSNDIVTENTVHYVGNLENIPDVFHEEEIQSIDFLYSGGMIQAIIQI